MTEDLVIGFLEEITKAFAGSPDLNKNFACIMRKAKALTSAEAWSFLIDETLQKTIPLKTGKDILKFRFKPGTGIAGLIFEKGSPLIIPDAAKDKRFDKKTDGLTGVEIKSLICVPFKVGDRMTGVLRLINKKRESPFTDVDMKLLTHISYCAAMMFERDFLYRKIEEISITDDLTSLYNIRYLGQSIEIEIERSRRYGSLFSLIFMDIDDLKKVNERFGHLSGSKVLIETAGLLQENLRKVDVIIRYGGDEFVMVLPQTQRESGFLVAERLRKMIEKNVYLKKEGLNIKVTASFGVASFPDDARSREELVKLADKAMYRAKLSTKNLVFAAK